jgi:hypothetical protein
MTMSPLVRSTAFFAFFGLFLAPMAHAQHTAMPAGMSHEQHMAQMKRDAEMKQHGNLAMGFDQDKTTITSISLPMVDRLRLRPTTQPMGQAANRFEPIFGRSPWHFVRAISRSRS